jgi:hypothetical protein
MDREKVIDELNTDVLPFLQHHCDMQCDREKRWISKMIITVHDTIELLKEQEKKEIKIHKKHVLTLNRNDEFSMRKLYESVCEKLLDEGEMVITRTDNHENVEFVFYVVND